MGGLSGPRWRKSSFSFSNGNCLEAASWRKSSHSHTDWTGQCAEVAAWRKGTRSYANGACAEVAAWRKGSRSNSQGACVETGSGPSVVGIRDSKDPDGPVLEVTPEGWGAFLGRIQAGASS